MANANEEYIRLIAELSNVRKKVEVLEDENARLYKTIERLKEEYSMPRLAEIHMDGYRRGINVLADRIEEIIAVWRQNDDEAISPADNNAGPQN